MAYKFTEIEGVVV